jgi:hypothetical protein
MRSALEVSAWVRIGEDCEMSYTRNTDNEVEILFGGLLDGFELIVPENAIARLAELVKRAMEETA